MSCKLQQDSIIIPNMSFLNDKLKAYPSLHKIYAKAYSLRNEYVTLLPLKFWYLSTRLKKHPKKTILCYPEKPVYNHALQQICFFLGYTITNIPQSADAVVHFEDTTFRKYDRVLRQLSKKYKVINYRCFDISKEKVEKIQQQAFGYGMSINPQTYKGGYVKKGNINSLHNGVVLDHPEKPEAGYVYQRLINHEVNRELVVLRVVVVGEKIPFVYLKFRPVNHMFGFKNYRVKIVNPMEVMSGYEYNKILKFCRSFGLDLGELDVLRDTGTKRLYVVDANNTPASPPYQVSMKRYKKVLKIMSEVFQHTFLNS